MYRSSFIGITSALLFACAGDPGTHPHDASSADHQAMAQQEDRDADAHNAEAKASGPEQSTAKNGFQCGRAGCWTSSTNPTDQHKKDAERHRELAAIGHPNIEGARAFAEAVKDQLAPALESRHLAANL